MSHSQNLRSSAFNILLLIIVDLVCLASALTTSIQERTESRQPICPPGGTYGRPDSNSCKDAWAIIAPYPTFVIPNLNEDGEILAEYSSLPAVKFEFINPGSVRSHPELETGWTPMRFPASQCIISVSLKDSNVEFSDLASNDDLLETAWWIMARCVTDRGIGGYDYTGDRKLIKVAVYSSNSKWDKQLNPADLPSVNALGGSGPALHDSSSYPSNQHGSSSGAGSGQSAPGSSSKPRKPKKRPTTRCEATSLLWS
ncbi:MAG: hypothetical protein M1835_004038 [Candelina submexicana]|nr:MAG: hypothetical protein M1835_004038 [Candelina submexicana]